MKATMLYVRLADNEWSSQTVNGVGLMEHVAREQLELHRDVENLIVHVTEHAGWFLVYSMQDENMIIVGTANDAAAVTPERRRFYENIRGAEWNTLPGINRQELAGTPT